MRPGSRSSRRLLAVHRSRLLLTILACLLIGLRFASDCIHASCYLDFQDPPVRAFYLHSGGDHNRCHHGQAPATPIRSWACSAAEDEQAFTLPEVPHLPIVVSVFTALALLVFSFEDRARIAANGRAPPSSLLPS